MNKAASKCDTALKSTKTSFRHKTVSSSAQIQKSKHLQSTSSTYIHTKIGKTHTTSQLLKTSPAQYISSSHSMLPSFHSSLSSLSSSPFTSRHEKLTTISQQTHNQHSHYISNYLPVHLPCLTSKSVIDSQLYTTSKSSLKPFSFSSSKRFSSSYKMNWKSSASSQKDRTHEKKPSSAKTSSGDGGTDTTQRDQSIRQLVLDEIEQKRKLKELQKKHTTFFVGSAGVEDMKINIPKTTREKMNEIRSTFESQFKYEDRNADGTKKEKAPEGLDAEYKKMKEKDEKKPIDPLEIFRQGGKKTSPAAPILENKLDFDHLQERLSKYTAPKKKIVKLPNEKETSSDTFETAPLQKTSAQSSPPERVKVHATPMTPPPRMLRRATTTATSSRPLIPKKVNQIDIEVEEQQRAIEAQKALDERLEMALKGHVLSSASPKI